MIDAAVFGFFAGLTAGLTFFVATAVAARWGVHR